MNAPIDDVSLTGRRDRFAFWLAVAVVLVTKLYILVTSTADVLGDYGRLLALADDMLKSSRWLYEGDIDKYALPPAIWKTPGYPLLMAVSKLALGEHWPWGLAILQAVLSFIAGLYVRRLALALGFGPVLAALAFVMYAWSVPASTDTLIMPDSLYGSIATMVIAVIGMRFLSGKSLSIGDALGAGLAIMVCFWVREGFAFLVAPLALMLLAPFLFNGMQVRRGLLLLAIFCAPAFLSAGGVMLWNRYRTGDYLVAIVSQTVYLIAILKVAEKVPTVFDGDTPLDKAARAGLRDYDYGDAQLLDERMFREYGIKAPELMRLAKEKYWQTIARYPGTFAITMWERLRYRQQASMLGDVLMRLDDLDWWRFVGPHKPYMTGWRLDMEKFMTTKDFRYLTASAVVHGLPRAALRAATLALFVLFTFALPLIVIRDLSRRICMRPATLLGSLFVLYWGVLFIYMLVGVEIRYLSLICSIPIFGSLWVCLRIAQRFEKPWKIAPDPL